MTHKCKQCGQEIFFTANDGLCPACRKEDAKDGVFQAIKADVRKASGADDLPLLRKDNWYLAIAFKDTKCDDCGEPLIAGVDKLYEAREWVGPPVPPVLCQACYDKLEEPAQTNAGTGENAGMEISETIGPIVQEPTTSRRGEPGELETLGSHFGPLDTLRKADCCQTCRFGDGFEDVVCEKMDTRFLTMLTWRPNLICHLFQKKNRPNTGERQ